MERLIKQREHTSPKTKLRSFIKVVILLFILSIVLELWLLSRLSTYGHKINEMDMAKQQLELENQVMENTLAYKTSYKEIENTAEQLGFASIKNIDYITPTNLSLAQ